MELLNFEKSKFPVSGFNAAAKCVYNFNAAFEASLTLLVS
jgi:hypothetical protein